MRSFNGIANHGSFKEKLAADKNVVNGGTKQGKGKKVEEEKKDHVNEATGRMNGATTRAQRNKDKKNGDDDVHMRPQDENPRTSPDCINLADSVEGRDSFLSQAADGQDGVQSLA